MTLRFLSPELEALLTDATKVVPHPDNPNNGETEKIVESMVLDGVYRPIYASRATGHIVAGHHVYEAMLSEGLDRVPVLWLDIDAEEELRILAKDNMIARLAWMDPALEMELVKKIANTEQGLPGTGYDDEWLVKAITASHVPYTPDTSSALDSVEFTCTACGHVNTVEVDRAY